MSAVFLSASVPDRDKWSDTARPHDIREAIVALVTIVLPKYELVFGGHPAISPLVEHAARSLGAVDRVHIYQSKEFEKVIPEAAKKFENFHWTDKQADRPSSLTQMREEMLRSRKFLLAFFIGGMEGIFEEYSLFQTICPGKPSYPIGQTGGASKMLLQEHTQKLSELGLYRELEDSKLYRSLFSKLLRQAETQEKISEVLPKWVDQDNRTLIADIWPVFKPLISSGALAGGSPMDVLHEWRRDVLLPACESSGDRGMAVFGQLAFRREPMEPQQVAFVTDFLRDFFRDKEVRVEYLTGLAVALLKMGKR